MNSRHRIAPNMDNHILAHRMLLARFNPDSRPFDAVDDMYSIGDDAQDCPCCWRDIAEIAITYALRVAALGMDVNAATADLVATVDGELQVRDM